MPKIRVGRVTVDFDSSVAYEIAQQAKGDTVLAQRMVDMVCTEIREALSTETTQHIAESLSSDSNA